MAEKAVRELNGFSAKMSLLVETFKSVMLTHSEQFHNGTFSHGDREIVPADARDNPVMVQPALLVQLANKRQLELTLNKINVAYDNMVVNAATATGFLLKTFPEGVDNVKILGFDNIEFASYIEAVQKLVAVSSWTWAEVSDIPRADNSGDFWVNEVVSYLHVLAKPGRPIKLRSLLDSYHRMVDLYSEAIAEHQAELDYNYILSNADIHEQRVTEMVTRISGLAERCESGKEAVLVNEINVVADKLAERVEKTRGLHDQLRSMTSLHDEKTNQYSLFTSQKVNNGLTEIKRILKNLNNQELVLIDISAKLRVSLPAPGPTTAPTAPTAGSSSVGSKLKRLEMRKWYGKDQAADFSTWMSEFKKLIEDHETSDLLRMIRLKSCLGEPALSLVKDLSSYSAAKLKLQSYYGSQTKIFAEVLAKIKALPEVHPGRPQSLVTFQETWDRSKLQLKEFGFYGDFMTYSTFTSFMKKFNIYFKNDIMGRIQENWTWEQKMDAISTLLEERYPDCLQLVQFGELDSIDNPRKVKALTARAGIVAEDEEDDSDDNGLSARALIATKNTKKSGDDSKRTTGGPPRNPGAQWKCIVPNCEYKFQHGLWQCKAFRSLSPDQGLKLVLEKKYCVLCLSAHKFGTCNKKDSKEHDWSCARMVSGKRCGLYHHTKLCQARNITHHSLTVTGDYFDGYNSIFMVQWVPYNVVDTAGGSNINYALLVWDSCATCNFARNDWARGQNFPHVPLNLEVKGINDTVTKVHTFLYSIVLILPDGKFHIKAVGLNTIASDIPGLDSSLLPNEIQHLGGFRPVGPIDLLIGINDQKIFPTDRYFKGNICINKSVFQDKFNNKLVLSGRLSSKKSCKIGPKVEHVNVASLSRIEKELFQVNELFGAEKMSSCLACRNCTECDVRSKLLSQHEIESTLQIERNMYFDQSATCWVARYPWNCQDYKEKIGNNLNVGTARALNLEAKLIKIGLAKEYTDMMREYIEDRKVYRPIAELPAPPDGWFTIIPVNYVLKDSATSPIRSTLDGSCKSGVGKKSVNYCLHKGIQSINTVHDTLLRWRTNRYSMIADLDKSYNHIDVEKGEKAVLQILWREMEHFGKPVEKVPFERYGITKISFGLKPSGCQLQLSLRNTAKVPENVVKFPAAAKSFVKSFLVDDLGETFSSIQEREKFIEECKGLAAAGGHRFKHFILSGEQDGEKEILASNFLGICWEPKEDIIIIRGKVNMSKKSRGKREKENESGSLEFLIFTKRIVLRNILLSFDPNGFAMPFIYYLRLQYRYLEQYGWDDELAEELNKTWREMFEELQRLEIKLPRAIWSNLDTVGYEVLAGGDGSKKGFGCCFYARILNEGGVYKSTLLYSKSKLAPKKLTSVPRLELLSSTLVSRCMVTLLESLSHIRIDKVYKVSDSTAVLGMITGNKLPKNDFNAYRVAEIRRAEQLVQAKGIDNKWYYIPSEDQVADVLSRGCDNVAFLQSQDWLEGPLWFRTQPVSSWPIVEVDEALRRNPHQDEEEEDTDDVVVHKGYVSQVDIENVPIEGLVEKDLKRGRFVRITALVLRAKNRFLSFVKNDVTLNSTFSNKKVFLDTWEDPRSVLLFGKPVDGTKKIIRAGQGRKLKKAVKVPVFSPAELAEAKLLWLKAATVSTDELKTYQNVKGFYQDGLVFAKTRTNMDVFQLDKVVILRRGHPFTNKVLIWIHYESLHASDNAVVTSSRREIYVIRARRLVAAIRRKCAMCTKNRMESMNPEMGQKLEVSIPLEVINKPFTSVFVDLTGHVWVTDNVRKRTKGKSYICVFRDSVFPLVGLELMEDLSLDAFLGAWSRFICRRGGQKFVFSDFGSQLRAAQKETGVEEWSWSHKSIQDMASEHGVVWQFAPRAAAWNNGIAEQGVAAVKKGLARIMHDKNMSFASFNTLVYQIEYYINSRPLYVGYSCPTDEFEGIVTGNHLLGINVRKGEISHEDLQRGGNLSKRMQKVQEVANQFKVYWSESIEAWEAQNKSAKWHFSKSRPPKVGDICWWKSDKKYKVGGTRLCRIIKLNQSSRHGGTYSVDVEYKLQNSLNFKVADNVPVRLLVLLDKEEENGQ